MKDRTVTIRLSEHEYNLLLSLSAKDPDCLMKKSGKPSLSSYIRKALFYSGNHPENLKTEIRDLTYQIRKAGININQAVHRINAGYGFSGQAEQLLSNQEQIKAFLFRILSLLEIGDDEGK